jgi:hypothetical protein
MSPLEHMNLQTLNKLHREDELPAEEMLTFGGGGTVCKAPMLRALKPFHTSR